MWIRVLKQQLVLTRRFLGIYLASFIMVCLLTLGTYFTNVATVRGVVMLIFPKFNLFFGIYLLSIVFTLMTTSNSFHGVYITRMRKVILIQNILRIVITELILMFAWLLGNIIGLIKSNLVEVIFQSWNQWVLRSVYLFLSLILLALLTFLGELIFRKKLLAFSISLSLVGIALTNSMADRFSIIYGMLNENIVVSFSIGIGILILGYVISELIILRRDF